MTNSKRRPSRSLTVAIPTWNNHHQLLDTLNSLVRNTDFQGTVLVINNGERERAGVTAQHQIQSQCPHNLTWLDAPGNIGWIGGINYALQKSDTELFCMLNDDVLFPPCSFDWWSKLLSWFDHDKVGGVGPTSNFVMGYQNAFYHGLPPIVKAQLLIGFCSVWRREVIADGLDPTLPGGDDHDLSIRVVDAGWDLVVDRRCYLHHIGQQTGRRITSEWDSQKHQAETYNALIRKHGLKRWHTMLNAPATAHYSFQAEDNVLLTTMRIFEAHRHSVQAAFVRAKMKPSDISQHLDTLYRYASVCKHVTEFGTNDGTSTVALLAARPETLITYDVERLPEVDKLVEWGAHFVHKDVLDGPIEPTDMLFIDDLHEGDHVAKELKMHAGSVARYIFFHDTALFGTQGQDGGRGIWDAIAEFLRRNRQWRICYMNEENNGLVGIEKV